jgi:pantoate kinase
MSAAGALATGLAVARALGIDGRRAVAMAHLSDLYGGGGLGGVAAILGGGLELRTRPGVPPLGLIRHRRFARSILLAIVGNAVASPRLLRDEKFLGRVRVAAGGSIERLIARPDAGTFLVEAERFTDELGLASRAVRGRLDGLRATGARAAQTMFGESLFIVPRTSRQRADVVELLERWRRPAVEVRGARSGAQALP